MYGLGDEIDGLREDITFLKDIVAALLPHAPADMRRMALVALKAKNLLPDETMDDGRGPTGKDKAV
jgi:hypothetical protein